VGWRVRPQPLMSAFDMTDADRYEELAAAARRVVRVWATNELAPAVNELRETLEFHGHDEEDPDVIAQEEALLNGQPATAPR